MWGGAQKYVYDLATHLSKEAFHVTVAAGGRGPLKEKIETAGLRYIAVKNFERDVRILKEFSVFIELLKLCRNILPDIVHLNGSKAGVLGSIASTIACPKAKIIFTTHGLPYFEKRPKWQKLLIYLSLKLSALFQDTIIAISRLDYKNALRRHLIAPNKLVFIPISINPKDYHYLPKNEAKSALSAKISAKEATITNDAVVIGTIAEYTKNKGLTYLIDALASLNTTNYKLQTTRPKDIKFYKFKSKVKYLEATVDPKLCPRFTAIIIENVAIAPSPNFIKNRLIACGIKSCLPASSS